MSFNNEYPSKDLFNENKNIYLNKEKTEYYIITSPPDFRDDPLPCAFYKVTKKNDDKSYLMRILHLQKGNEYIAKCIKRESENIDKLS